MSEILFGVFQMSEEQMNKQEPEKSEKSKKRVRGRNGGYLIPGHKGMPPVNPSGRPKGSKNRSTIFKKWMEIVVKSKNPFSNELEDMTVEDRMVLKMITQVLQKGDVQAFKEAYDSVYGKHKERIDHTTAGEKLQLLNAPERVSFEKWEKVKKDNINE